MMATKRQKVDNIATYKEEVLFNSDTLSRIISYLPSVDVLSLALTCKRFGVSNTDDDSIIKKSTLCAIRQIATEEQLAALPHYEGESSLADYHYLQLLRKPLAFDQFVDAGYVTVEDKSCARRIRNDGWGVAFSNNILRAGKHYVIFKIQEEPFDPLLSAQIGVMRPGQANKQAYQSPFSPLFFQNFSRSDTNGNHHVNEDAINCCIFSTSSGDCNTSNWVDRSGKRLAWGMRSRYGDDETFCMLAASGHTCSEGRFGILLDLDEGTLAVYKDGQKLGVTTGLSGQYCWVVTVNTGVQATIERGTIGQAEEEDGS